MNEETKTCKCGHGIDNPWVSDRARYSLGGWLLIFIGISALPSRIERSCERCGFVFSTSTDKKAREARRYR